MAGDDELSPKELIDGEEKTFREGKVQFSTSLSYLKEMWVGSAGEAWRLMLQKGALTASPLVAVLLGGPIGLGCHFCYLILCMWTRQIQRGWGLSAGEADWGKRFTPAIFSSSFLFFFCPGEKKSHQSIKFNFLIWILSRFYSCGSHMLLTSRLLITCLKYESIIYTIEIICN